MKRFFFLMMAALCAMPFCFAQLHSSSGDVKKVAILEVVDKENKLNYGVKLMLRSSLAEAVSNTAGYEGYDRVDLASIMGEQNFQRTGMVSDEQIKKLGEMTGAAYILVAEAAVIDDEHMFITAKILDVESARLENQKKEMSGMTPEEFDIACGKLAAKLFGGTAPRPGSPAPRPTPGGNGQNYTETAWGINMQMVYVPGGEFMMGCTGEQGSECENDEKNIHRVSLSGYYIGMLEVTQGQWEKVMGTSIYQQQSKAGSSSSSSYPIKGAGSDYPMYYVSWEEAMAFCEELSRKTGKKYTLPTEAQWEYAARGGNKNDGTKYSGSSSVDVVAWYTDNSGSSTHTCGTKRPNGLGIYDMSGNVYEWCKDWYADSYISYQNQDPEGPSSGSYRVVRGGGWCSNAQFCRVAYRGNRSPSYRSNRLGFRVVMLP